MYRSPPKRSSSPAAPTSAAQQLGHTQSAGAEAARALFHSQQVTDTQRVQTAHPRQGGSFSAAYMTGFVEAWQQEVKQFIDTSKSTAAVLARNERAQRQSEEYLRKLRAHAAEMGIYPPQYASAPAAAPAQPASSARRTSSPPKSASPARGSSPRPPSPPARPPPTPQLNTDFSRRSTQGSARSSKKTSPVSPIALPPPAPTVGGVTGTTTPGLLTRASLDSLNRATSAADTPTVPARPQSRKARRGSTTAADRLTGWLPESVPSYYNY